MSFFVRPTVLPASTLAACDPPLACVPPSDAAEASTTAPAGCGCAPDPLDTEPAVMLEGEGTFGNYVDAAPDVDGDGFDDLVVAAFTTGTSSGLGAFHVYRGSAESLESTPWASVEGTTTDAHRRRARWERARHGNSSIQYGAPMFLLLALPSLLAPRAFAEDLLTGPADSGFGHALAAGDWNGDGFADLAVGAPGVSAAWLYLGSEDGLAPGDTLGSTAEADEFGAAMTGCDLNGDSFTDLVVGAPQDASGDGGFYVWYGSMEGLSGGLFTTGEEGSAGQLGLALACAGDVDGDGFEDLLVGAPAADRAAGEVRVYRGSVAGLDEGSVELLEHEGAPSWFGWSLTGLGDIDGDGHDDVAVGAPDSPHSDHGFPVGAVWVYSGGVDGLEVSRTFDAYDGEAQAYGYAVAGAGDVDGDGTPELAVGNNPYTYGYDHAWVDGVKLTPPVGGSGFGCVLASAGDVDADGYADLLVGAGGYLCLGFDQGYVCAWLYRGSADGVSEAWNLSTGHDQPATALRGVGDIDGDGDDDVAVGMGWDDTVTVYAGAPSDADGDGVENPAWGGNDCDDADAGLYPGATEVAGDGIDQDCDGVDASEDPDEPTPTPAVGDAACGCGGPVALTLPAVLVAGFFGTRRRQTAYREVVTTRTAVSG